MSSVWGSFHGKLILSGCTPDELPKLAAQMGIETIDANAAELSSAHKLPRLHKDPLDRLIIHQAITRKMTLVSHDEAFDDYVKLGLKIL